jgi:hypothetical protein
MTAAEPGGASILKCEDGVAGPLVNPPGAKNFNDGRNLVLVIKGPRLFWKKSERAGLV